LLCLVGSSVYALGPLTIGGGAKHTPSTSFTLGEAPALAEFRSQLVEGEQRHADLLMPGNDVGAVSGYSYAWQATTGYAVGEHTYDGEDQFVVITGGTSGGTVPSWNKTTPRSIGSATGGSQTTDGTVVWQYLSNAVTLWGTGGFDGANARSYRISNTNGAPNGYYDFGAVVWSTIDYFDRIGTITTALRQRWEAHASYWIANYIDTRNPDCIDGAGYWVFTDGILQDNLRTSSRYKYASVINDTCLSDAVGSGAPFANTGATNWTTPADETFMAENNMIREMAYLMKGTINSNKAGNSYRSVTIGGVTDNIFRWYIPYALNHLSQYMNDIDSGAGVGIFSPFMSGLMSHSLIEWVEWETSQGRDPDRYTSHVNIGSVAANLNWRTNATHGVARAWPTIVDALDDFWCWAYTEAEADNAAPMWNVAASAFLYRNDEPADGPQPDLNNLISHAPAYIAKYRHENGGSNSDCTVTEFITFADLTFETAIEDGVYEPTYTSQPYFWGKQQNEKMKLAFYYLDYRNALSGRND
jgi:hypothetical protein